MSVVQKLKSRAQRERDLMFKPPDYKLIEEQAIDRIEQLENIIENIDFWYKTQTKVDSMIELGEIINRYKIA